MRTSLAIDELAAHHALSTVPEVWIDLVHGHTSADEAAAAAAVDEPDELVERSRALFAPPSAEDEERRLEALLEAHFAEPAPAANSTPPARSRWVVGGVVAMLAASLLLVFVSQPPPFDGGYSLTMSPGYLEERAEPTTASETPRYYEGQRIEVHLRPMESVALPLDVNAFVFALADGRSHELAVEPEINEHGVVSIAGSTDALGLSVGRWTLVVVVGPPEHLPKTLDDVHDEADAPYDVLTTEVEIVSADPSSP